MEEQWKSIINYPNYEISNLGNCRNIKTNKNLKCCKIKNEPYIRIGLYRRDENGKNQHIVFRIHRLVAMHFIPNPENKREVDHIDNNKLNNSILNLRWATTSENGRNKSTSGQKNITSQYMGVEYDKRRNKWRYQLRIGKITKTKQFNTEHEAAVKRDEFILDNDLEYFKLNFIHI